MSKSVFFNASWKYSWEYVYINDLITNINKFTLKLLYIKIMWKTVIEMSLFIQTLKYATVHV